MKFGERYEDAPPPVTNDRRWMKTFKPGETRVRFLQEVKDWTTYWEHYNPNPGGFPFPCTRDQETCPGCNSGIERMERAQRKVACNIKVGEFVEVYKLSQKLANRMDIRSERNGGTILDRDYLLTRVGNDKETEYDVDSLSQSPAPTGLQLHNIEELLGEAFTEAWPDFTPGDDPKQAKNSAFQEGKAGSEPDFAKNTGSLDESSRAEDEATDRRNADMRQAHGYPEPTPEPEEKEVSEADLRKMTPDELTQLCKGENIALPDHLLRTDEIVDWLIEQMS